jgi:hypothetical protein
MVEGWIKGEEKITMNIKAYTYNRKNIYIYYENEGSKKK